MKPWRPNPAEPATAVPCLSPRMIACLEWASCGKSSVDIGALLGISARTVDDHLSEARRRLGVRTRVQAIVGAIQLGLLTMPEARPAPAGHLASGK